MRMRYINLHFTYLFTYLPAHLAHNKGFTIMRSIIDLLTYLLIYIFRNYRNLVGLVYTAQNVVDN